MDDGTNGTPVLISLREAARRSGLSKSALSRKVRSGEISVREKGEDGTYRIDPSELLRFMDSSRVSRCTQSAGTTGTTGTTSGTAGTAPGSSPGQAIALVEERAARKLAEERLADLKGMVEELRRDRDVWRDQASAAMRLLPAREPGRRRWWWRSG